MIKCTGPVDGLQGVSRRRNFSGIEAPMLEKCCLLFSFPAMCNSPSNQKIFKGNFEIFWNEMSSPWSSLILSACLLPCVKLSEYTSLVVRRDQIKTVTQVRPRSIPCSTPTSFGSSIIKQLALSLLTTSSTSSSLMSSRSLLPPFGCECQYAQLHRSTTFHPQ
jgi:hypothetical protein